MNEIAFGFSFLQNTFFANSKEILMDGYSEFFFKILIILHAYILPIKKKNEKF